MEFTEEQAEEYPEHLPRICIERSSRVYRKKKVTAGTPSSGGEQIGQARFVPHRKLRNSRHLGQPKVQTSLILPLVSREWKNGSNSSYNCTPFLHSLLTKGK